jgi:hypothetical protein
MDCFYRWGETNSTQAVMAHMYEGILYGLWAPLVNLYAQQFYGRVTLNNALQYLHIFGESDAGKDKFAEFVLRLLSDNLVRGSAGADSVGVEQIRSLRNIDTVFPHVVSDISKQKIERIDPPRNFWKDSWHPSNDISYPTIIFTSNDSRPNDYCRNRAKMLHFYVAFPSNPMRCLLHRSHCLRNFMLKTVRRLSITLAIRLNPTNKASYPPRYSLRQGAEIIQTQGEYLRL